MTAPKTRTFDMSIDLEADVDTVWKALTDATELVRWFPTQATVDPQPGGRFLISWDGDWVWDHTVTDAVPGQRFRVVDRAARPYDAAGRPLNEEQPVEIALEFDLEGRSGGTRLRLVHSGFGHGAAWDDEVDGITSGWNIELRCLRHYLAHHRGKNRTLAWAKVVSQAPVPEVWSRLVSRSGLVARGETAWLQGGDRCTLELTTGDVIDGTVIWSDPGSQLVIDAHNRNHAFVRLGVDRMGGQVMTSVWLSDWDLPEAETRAFTDRMQQALERTFVQNPVSVV